MSPITAEDFNNQATSQDLCDAFRNKLLNNDKLATLLGYLFAADGKFSATDDSFGQDLVLYMLASASPIGSLMFIPGAPAGVLASEWLPCSGQTYDKADFPWAAQFVGSFGITEDTLAGTFTMPDYDRRYLRVAGTGVAAGSISADAVIQVDAHTLLADHTHFIMNQENRLDNNEVWDFDNGTSIDGTSVLQAAGSNDADTDRYLLTGSATVATVGKTSLPNQVDEEITPVDTIDLVPADVVVTAYMRVGYRIAGTVINP